MPDRYKSPHRALPNYEAYEVLVSSLHDIGCEAGDRIQPTGVEALTRDVIDIYGDCSLGSIAHYLTGERIFLPPDEWFDGLPPRHGMVTNEQLHEMGAKVLIATLADATEDVSVG